MAPPCSASKPSFLDDRDPSPRRDERALLRSGDLGTRKDDAFVDAPAPANDRPGADDRSFEPNARFHAGVGRGVGGEPLAMEPPKVGLKERR